MTRKPDGYSTQTVYKSIGVPSPVQLRAAGLAVAGYAKDRDDLIFLLEMLGMLPKAYA